MMRQYELVERVQKYKPDANEALLNKAYVYAMQKHGKQTRASGDPYISHPLEVAAILTDMHLDESTIAVALLHDTIEDTSATRAEIDELLGEYKAAGVVNILALGGDLPTDPSQLGPSEFRYALDLVEHLRANFDVCIGVAAHPEVHPRSTSRQMDREHLAEKLRLADFAMTQFFFDVEHYRRLVDELAALGVTKPVIPGVMPVTNKGQIVKMAQMSGAALPTWLIDRLASLEQPEDIRKFGVEVATKLSSDLLDAGAPGLHLYTLNRSVAPREIFRNLGLS